MRRLLLAVLLLAAFPAVGQPAILSGGPCKIDGTGCFTLGISSLTPVTASKLLGRGSAGGTGAAQEITVGSGLSLSGTTLTASASSVLTVTAYTADQALSAGQSGAVISNVGATGAVVLDLPTGAVTGVTYTIAVEAAQLLYIKPGTGQTLRRQTSVATNGGGTNCANAASIGTNMYLIATSATTWVATGGIGSWTFGACP